MDISFIIVNWNTRDLLQNCLDSIIKTAESLTYEIIVVDNASTDGSAEMLVEKYPQVRMIANRENRGFGANNQGFAVMKGKYALLINTDAVLTNGAARKLWPLRKLTPTPRLSAASCSMPTEANRIRRRVSDMVDPCRQHVASRTSFSRKYPSKRYEHTVPLEVDSAIGACMMIRKSALDNVAFFDERYFFFFEETDLAYAMRRAGWRVYQVPDALIYHLQGQSIGRNARSRIEFYRSRYQFLRKWHNGVYYRLAAGIIFFRLLADTLLNGVGVILTLAWRQASTEIIYIFTDSKVAFLW